MSLRCRQVPVGTAFQPGLSPSPRPNSPQHLPSDTGGPGRCVPGQTGGCASSCPAIFPSPGTKTPSPALGPRPWESPEPCARSVAADPVASSFLAHSPSLSATQSPVVASSLGSASLGRAGPTLPRAPWAPGPSLGRARCPPAWHHAFLQVTQPPPTPARTSLHHQPSWPLLSSAVLLPRCLHQLSVPPCSHLTHVCACTHAHAHRAGTLPPLGLCHVPTEHPLHLTHGCCFSVCPHMRHQLCEGGGVFLFAHCCTPGRAQHLVEKHQKARGSSQPKGDAGLDGAGRQRMEGKGGAGPS